MHRPIPSLLIGVAALLIAVLPLMAHPPSKRPSPAHSSVIPDPFSGYPYNYNDIAYAHGAGCSMSTIAFLYRVSEYSKAPFRRIVDKYLTGISLDYLEEDYDVPITVFDNLSDESDRINAFMTHVEAAGARPLGDYPVPKSMYGVDHTSVVRSDAGLHTVVSTMVTRGAADIIATTPDLHVFSQLIRQANLTYTLNNLSPVTILAPTDDAFARMPAVGLAQIKSDPVALRNLIMNHVLTYQFDSATIAKMTVNALPPSLEGSRLSLEQDSTGAIIIGGARVVHPDVLAANGYIHEIDEVLVPSE